ncbi:Tripartite-type tricarboxylate transporter, receptor component TctC [Variovorax sp. CF079]|uniref:tripartite tricarboxylate transporter substrate-binding protein n=1 Tax=Variovorax sp. CF079 TaxID=1882774 RepID=UPI000884C13E|nr:tripartite tricarboxylate transporter substrate-binding protein [Variovorax sp. CF079]SDE73233.1 Tripartite-type tricarboxylate transporter, receptor component TctC [Variovorax sp. CF079]
MQRRQLIAAAAASCLAVPSVRAQEKALRIVVPFAPGGSGDLIPRMVAPVLSELLRQPVIVENRSGVGGSLGANHVARSAPDGFTLGVATVSTHGIYPAVMKHAPYDPLKDFVAVSNLARVPNVVSVHPAVAAKDMREFVALARDPKSYLEYGSPGVGSLGHMMGELFKQATGVYMLHIPYRGAGPALADAMAGQIKVLFDNLPASLPHVRSGRLRALAVAWPARLPHLPSVPTFSESGLPAVNDPAWFGLVAPAGTPPGTVQRLQQAVAAALARPELRTRIEELGAVPLGNSSEVFAQELQAEFAKWQRVAKAGGISLEAS